MKKCIFFCIAFLLAFVGYAQTNPNRIIVHEKSGNVSGYLAERVDSLTFGYLEGEVAAKIDFKGYSEVEGKGVLTLAVTRTVDCSGFAIDVIPTVTANMISDIQMASYLKDSKIYFQDFQQGELSGVEMNPATNYTIVTLGYDQWGIGCGVDRVNFTTPKTPVEGDPKVAMSVVDTQLQEFTVRFEPHCDVTNYYVLAMKEGELLSQFEMFAPMFGYANLSEMVKGFGQIPYTGVQEVPWKKMDPNTTYQVYVQALDKAGNYADLDSIAVNTAILGGPGKAVVDIKLGDYVLADWYGVMKPSQFITYTPNDQTACWRCGVYKAADYDKDPDIYKADVCSEPPMPNMEWFQFEGLTTDYQCDTNTEFVALAAGKNINGEWGALTVVRFTTPAAAAAARSSALKGAVRLNKVGKPVMNFEPGKVPSFNRPNVKKTVTLKEKR